MTTKDFNQIVVIDDDKDIIRFVSFLLKQQNYQVKTFRAAKKALEYIRESPPHFVITDWHMPGMSGEEFCQQLRQGEYPHHVFTLMLTGTASQHLIQSLDAGADDFLTKPVNPAELLARINAGKRIVELSHSLRERRDELKKLASTDALTGLMNRFQFNHELDASVADANTSDESMALLVIDLDRFKEINDTLGHPVGDKALQEIAKRLQQVCPEDDVARLGGDEFCIIQRNVTTEDDAIQLAQRINDAMLEPLSLHDHTLSVGASIGIAFCPRHATDPHDLLTFADTALYDAKEKRIGYSVYQRELTERLLAFRALKEKLIQAIERDEFFLVYQPQVNLDTGKVVGVEALIRWQRDGESISPAEFIPTLERSHQIVQAGRWILREACRQLRDWQQRGFEITVSVNVSPIQFEDPAFLESVTDAVEEFGADASLLDFEITEGLLIQDIEEIKRKLQALKSLGSTISIDDFGTGYSSLAYLRQFPLDRLKIDRAFVRDIPDGDDGVIASSIVLIGNSLGLNVLAEGVETEEQVAFLKGLNCNEFQGYYHSVPLTADEVERFFEPAVAVAGS